MVNNYSETCTEVSQFCLSLIVGYIDGVPLLKLIVYYLLHFLAQGLSLILLKRNGLFFSY